MAERDLCHWPGCTEPRLKGHKLYCGAHRGDHASERYKRRKRQKNRSVVINERPPDVQADPVRLLELRLMLGRI